jgi:hypothetical protein
MSFTEVSVCAHGTVLDWCENDGSWKGWYRLKCPQCAASWKHVLSAEPPYSAKDLWKAVAEKTGCKKSNRGHWRCPCCNPTRDDSDSLQNQWVPAVAPGYTISDAIHLTDWNMASSPGYNWRVVAQDVSILPLFYRPGMRVWSAQWFCEGEGHPDVEWLVNPLKWEGIPKVGSVLWGQGFQLDGDVRRHYWQQQGSDCRVWEMPSLHG